MPPLQHIDCVGANITTYGPAFLDFLGSCRHKFQVLAFWDHHLTASEIVAAQAKVIKHGYRGFWSPARPTGHGDGSSGGTAILVDSGITASQLALLPNEANDDPACIGFENVTPVVVQLRGQPVVLISTYFIVGAGLGGANCSTMQLLAVLVSLFDLPWLIVGDFNVPFAVMMASAWLTRMQGVACRP